MQRQENKVLLSGFSNFYCDGLFSSLGEFFSLDQDLYQKILKELGQDDISTLIDYAVLKNKMAGVRELFIKVPSFGYGTSSLDKFGLLGKEIVDSSLFQAMPANAMIGDRVILEIESLADINQNFLNEIADFSARTDTPLLFKVGQTLEELGRVANMNKCSPMELLESYGFLDRKCYLYGLNFIDKDDQKLIKQYEETCIFSPISDGEEGKGAINLYNFIYNDIKFCFSSGKCYNIDMLAEGKLAKINTSNLMHDGSLIDAEMLLNALCCTQEKDENLEVEMSLLEPLLNIFDKKVFIFDDSFLPLREKVIEIIKKIKEKI